MKKHISVEMVKNGVSDGISNVYSVSAKKDTFLDSIKLFFSKKGATWTPKVAGKLAVKLENTGDDVAITFHGGKSIILDYSELSDLYILLNEYEKTSEWKHKITDL